MKSRIQSQALHHELCFPTVPNDPLVPTAVLGEARNLYHQSLFYFPLLHASQLLAWVVSCPHSNSLTLGSPLVFQIDPHSPDRDNELCLTHLGLVDLNGRHTVQNNTPALSWAGFGEVQLPLMDNKCEQNQTPPFTGARRD